jgi:hypothetical protein
MKKVSLCLLGVLVAATCIVYLADSFGKWRDHRNFYQQVDAYHTKSGPEAAHKALAIASAHLQPAVRDWMHQRLRVLGGKPLPGDVHTKDDSYSHVMCDICGALWEKAEEDMRNEGLDPHRDRNEVIRRYDLTPGKRIMDMHQARERIGMIIFRIAISDLELSKTRYTYEDLIADKARFPQFKEELETLIAANQ